jgi:hypothetical protein
MEGTDIRDYAYALAEEVNVKWRKASYQEESFPKIAGDALLAMPFPDDINAEALFRYGLLYEDLEYQSNPGYSFGDPPMALCRKEHFEVGVLFWLEGTTSIHQHSFSGAFQVLEGSSLQSEYVFDCHEKINERLLLGNLRWKNSEILKRRDVRPIVAGDQFIHSLFHMGHPSITLIIRTHSESRMGPQFNYHKPGFAFDPFYTTKEATLHKRLFASMLSLGIDKYEETIRTLYEKGDLEKNLNLLLSSISILREQGINPEKHIKWALGEKTDLHKKVSLLIQEDLRSSNLAVRRKDIKDEGHRFFLALLLNLPHREAIFESIETHMHGEDPTQPIENWVRQLCTGKDESQLGVDMDEMRLAVFGGMIRGLADGELRSAVEKRLSIKETPFVEKEFQMAQLILPSTHIFGPLFVTRAQYEAEGN